METLYKNPGYPRFVNDEATGERYVCHTAEYWQPFGDPLVDRLLDLDDLRLRVITSSNFLAAAFHCTRETLGIQKIMLGTDYPFEITTETGDSLEGLSLSHEEQTTLDEGNPAKLGFTL